MAESLRVVLENGACTAPFRFAFEIIVDSFGLVAGNEDAFRSLEWERICDNPVYDCPTANGQETLRQIVGVWAHAFALACNRQNNLHFHSFLFGAHP